MSATILTSGQGTTASGGATINTTGANLIVVWALNMPPGYVINDSVGGNNNNSLWQSGTIYTNGTYRLQIWWCWNPTYKGSGHNFVDTAGGVSGANLHVACFNCTTSYATLDVESGYTDPGVFGGTSVQPGSVTPTANDGLVLSACFCQNSSGTAYSGFSVNSGMALAETTTLSSNGGASAYLNQTTAANINPTFSWTTYAGRIIGVTAVLKAAAIGGSAPVLSSPTATGGTLTGSGTVSTDTSSGTLWWKVDASTTATDPGAGSESGAGWTSQTVTASGTQTVSSFGTLTAGTKYAHYLHVASGGRSSVANTSSFTVSSGSTPVTFSGTVPSQSGAVGVSFSLALSSYFSGTLTPFTYSVFSGSLPPGLSLNTSTGAITGTPTTAGSYTAVVRATDTGSNTANSNSIGFTIASSGTRTVTLTLTTDGTTPSANLTGLKWAFFDQTNPGSFVSPSAKGTGATTDASGILSLTVTGTSLTAGQIGWLVLSNSDGTITQNPACKSFCAPVVVS